MHIKIILLAVAILTLTTTGFAAPGKPINLALIADQTSGVDKSPLISLLEVELSQKEGIQLLERAAIDSILQEQQLSAAGLLDRNNTIKIGKLLRADAFIILSSEKSIPDSNMASPNLTSGDLIRVRVSETAHGLRLLDYFAQSDSNSVGNIVQKLESVLNKINQPDEKLIPVGIVDIHRVQLAEQYKMLERTLPVLLSVRLNLEPQIIMLEREDLKVLLDEKLMTEGEDTEFWSSAILIDGYIQPNNGQLEMHLNLKQAAGENLKSIIVTVEPNEPSKAIVKATTEIIQQLQNFPPTAKWQPEQEAEQFYKQGMMLVAHSRYEEAFSPLETAHALQPQNIYYTGSLFETIFFIRSEIEEVIRSNNILVENSKKSEIDILEQFTRSLNEPNEYSNTDTESAKKLSVITSIINRKKSQINNTNRPTNILRHLKEPKECPYTDMELAELLSVFLHQIQEKYNKGDLSARDINNNFSKCIGTGLRGSSGYLSSSVSVSNEMTKQLNRENRKRWIDTYSKALENQPIRNDYPQMNNQIQAHLAWLSSDIPEELITNLRKTFTEFIMPPESGGKIKSAQERDILFEQAFLVELIMLSPINLERTHLRNGSEEFLKLWQEYVNELANSDNESVSSKGKLAIAQRISVSPNDSQREQAERLAPKTVKDMVEKLTNPDEILDSGTKRQLITNMKRSLQPRSFISDEEKSTIWKNIYKFFIAQKDIEGLVELGTLPLSRNRTDLSKSSYYLLESMTEVLQTRKNDNKVNSTLAQIKDFQSRIKKVFPELEREQTNSNLSVSMLLTQKDWPEQVQFNETIFKIQDETIWIAVQGTYFSRSTIGQAGINLKKKKVISICQTEIFPDKPPIKLPGMIVNDNANYIFLQNIGILEFPGKQAKEFGFFIDSNTIPKEVFRIDKLRKAFNKKKSGENDTPETPRHERKLILYTQKNGLPSVQITSIAQAENNLWIAYGGNAEESGLGLYNLNTEQWETFLCSTIKDNNPFGENQPYQISSMTYINPHKLYFSISGIKQSGLWKMDPVTKETKFIHPITGDLDKDLNGNFQLQSSGYLCKIDPNTDKITLIIRPSQKLLRRYPEKNIAFVGLEEDMFLPESFLENIDFGPHSIQGYLDCSTGTIHNNKFWARLGNSQILIIEKGKSFDDAQIIDNNILNGEPVERFVSTPYGLIGIGDGIVGLIEIEKQ